MLKIKDNIDLKELEKYGFRKYDIIDDITDEVVWRKDCYCISQVFNEYKNGEIYDFEVELYVNEEKHLDICTYAQELDLHFIFDLICKLAKDDIIEEG